MQPDRSHLIVLDDPSPVKTNSNPLSCTIYGDMKPSQLHLTVRLHPPPSAPSHAPKARKAAPPPTPPPIPSSYTPPLGGEWRIAFPKGGALTTIPSPRSERHSCSRLGLGIFPKNAKLFRNKPRGSVSLVHSTVGAAESNTHVISLAVRDKGGGGGEQIMPQMKR